MRVLVACEFSGTVREAFKAKGHDAWSCDTIDSEIEGNHLKGDVLNYLKEGWDLMIGHPPCTYLAVSGNRWFKTQPTRKYLQEMAIEFFLNLWCSGIPKICLENPIGVMSTVFKKPDQIIQPYQFGHPETKATCLWLKNLPKLEMTNWVRGRENRIHNMFLEGVKDLRKERSRTYQGIANAMAEQWG